jgi:hypothetical protein
MRRLCSLSRCWRRREVIGSWMTNVNGMANDGDGDRDRCGGENDSREPYAISSVSVSPFQTTKTMKKMKRRVTVVVV